MNAYLTAYHQFEMSTVYLAAIVFLIFLLLLSLLGERWRDAHKRLLILLISVPIFMLALHNTVVTNFNYNNKIAQRNQLVEKLLTQRFGKSLITVYIEGHSITYQGYVHAQVILVGKPYNGNQQLLVNPWLKVILKKSSMKG